ncbi:biotin transport system ATP-binding protein [Pseudooceanicola antarcticus]|uniref:ABC transporter ATP-binding protein n=1 Tax=Pseudooceanicola antarcticus TaxID=1247613 RepID=A0A285IJE9_9RHOB|nr:ABC transporter ATP-binding protein [Pseudooceanicola antarcticus]PJE28828.1 ABC transporter ATP-binding protein [Pseudooceanicola antarcticus]SNY48105.1 biotin transport system ATP-binding protein [Pseudooceanicola antarcticus]
MTKADPQAQQKARLQLEAVSLEIDGRPILRELELSVAFHRMGVLGRNGSGKSTLSRLISGLVTPSAGRALLNGADMAADRRAALSEVGILFQNPDHQIIFPTVLEEVSFGLAQQGRKQRDAEAEARATLERFGKAHWAEVAVATLSQGQKHLVCLMSVVAMAPRVLVLDEPFAGLDLPTKMQLRRALGQFPGALIHVSHDPEDIADCDVCLWLDAGRLVEAGEGARVGAAYLEAMRKLGAGDDLSDLSG